MDRIVGEETLDCLFVVHQHPYAALLDVFRVMLKLVSHSVPVTILGMSSGHL